MGMPTAVRSGRSLRPSTPAMVSVFAQTRWPPLRTWSQMTGLKLCLLTSSSSGIIFG